MFEVKNLNFESTIRQSFARQSFMTTLGASLTSIEPGQVEIRYNRADELLQQHGFLHAGVSTTIVDSACGYAALTLAEADCEVLTSEFSVHFLRPASGKHFLALGKVIKPGKLLTICEGQVSDAESGALIAKMTATMVIRSKV